MIRKITEKDYEKVKKLVEQVHELHMRYRPDLFVNEGLLNADYFNDIVNNSMSYVYDAGEILGVIVAFERGHNPIPILRKKRVCFVEILAVDEGHQHQGIGHALCDYLIDECKKNGLDTVELFVYPFNADATEFYEEMGFDVKSVKYEYRL